MENYDFEEGLKWALTIDGLASRVENGDVDRVLDELLRLQGSNIPQNRQADLSSLLARTYHELGRAREAEDAYRQAIAEFELTGQYWRQGSDLNNYAGLLRDLGRLDESRNMYLACIRAHERQMDQEKDPPNVDRMRQNGQSEDEIAETLKMLERSAREEHFAQVAFIAQAHYGIGNVNFDLDDETEALRHYGLSVQNYRVAAEEFPEKHSVNYAISLGAWAKHADEDQAGPAFQKAYDLLQPHANDSLMRRVHFAKLCLDFGTYESLQSNYSHAIDLFERAIGVFQRAIGSQPRLVPELGICYYNLAICCSETGAKGQAIYALNQAIEFLKATGDAGRMYLEGAENALKDIQGSRDTENMDDLSNFLDNPTLEDLSSRPPQSQVGDSYLVELFAEYHRMIENGQARRVLDEIAEGDAAFVGPSINCIVHSISGLAYYSLGNYEYGDQEYERAIALADSAGEQELEVKFTGQWAKQIADRGDTPKALERYTEGIRLANTYLEDFKDSDMPPRHSFVIDVIRMHREVGCIYSSLGRNEAQDSFQDALMVIHDFPYESSNQFNFEHSQVLTAMGEDFALNNQLLAAEGMFSEATDILRYETRDGAEEYIPYLGAAMTRLGEVQWLMGKKDDAMRNLEYATLPYGHLFKFNPDKYSYDFAVSMGKISHLFLQTGLKQPAVDGFEKVVNLFRRLAAYDLDRYGEEAMKMMGLLAEAYRSNGNESQALLVSQEAAKVAQDLDSPRKLDVFHDSMKLGDELFQKQDYIGAVEAYEDAFSIRRTAVFDSLELANDYMNAGNSLMTMLLYAHQPTRAKEVGEEMLERMDKIRWMDDDRIVHRKSNLHNNLGAAYNFLGDPELGLASKERGVQALRELATRRPDDYNGEFASTLTNLACAYGNFDRLSEGLGAIEESLAILQIEVEKKNRVRSIPDYAKARNAYGNILSRMNRPKEALDEIQNALSLFESLVRAGRTEYEHGIADCLRDTFACLVYLEQFEKAAMAGEEALNLYRRLGQRDIFRYFDEITKLLSGLARVYTDSGHYRKAIDTYEDEARLYSIVVEQNFGQIAPQIASIRTFQADCYCRLFRYELALDSATEAYKLYEPGQADFKFAYCVNTAILVEALEMTGETEKSRQLLRELLPVRTQLKSYLNEMNQDFVVSVLSRLRKILNDRRRLAESIQVADMIRLIS